MNDKIEAQRHWALTENHPDVVCWRLWRTHSTTGEWIPTSPWQDGSPSADDLRDASRVSDDGTLRYRIELAYSAPKPEAQAAGDAVTFWLIVRNGNVEFGQDLADLPAPASHDAQQPACDCENPEPANGAALVSMECPIHNENPKQQQPAVVGDDAEGIAFEAWLSRTCPSGDVECVQRQWEASSDFEDFQNDRAESIAALTPAATPGDYLHPGARVEWQDQVGRWWPVTIIRHRPESYDAELDDGCDALNYPRGRFRRIAAQKEGNGNG